MFWRKRRYTMDEFNTLYALVSEKVTAMNEEARKQHMVEIGLLPQDHLTRKDLMKHRQRLELEGRAILGRRLAGTPDDPDLTAREED